MAPAYLEQPCRSALNRVSGMPFRWSLNPYMGCAHRCTFCYVRHFEQRADRPADDHYGRAIRVKVNVVDVLRRELRRRSWAREEVTVGAATDPYQPCEGRYRLTRGCLEALTAADTPFSIITRGPLILRDIDVLCAAAGRVPVSVHVSVPSLDERVWRTTEPGTASPSRRLDVVRRLADAGLDVGVAVAPVLPGLSDDPEQLAAVTSAARHAGARSIWAAVVNLRPGTREHFLEALARDWPDQIERYERLFAASPYVDAASAHRVRETVRSAAATTTTRRRPALEPAPRDVQLVMAFP